MRNDRRRDAYPAVRGLSRPGMALFFAVLGALVIASFFVYVSRLSDAPGGDSDSNPAGKAFTQAKVELTAPDNVKVMVGQGATITWDSGNDVHIIGYNVYRYKSGDGPADKVNAAIVSDNVYHDDEGNMFNSYAVAAVDDNGREGALSAPVAAVVEPVSLTGLTPTRQPEKIENAAPDRPPEKPLPPTLVGCTDRGITYQGVWYLEHYAEVTGGCLMVTPYYGDSASYTFNGDNVAVIATRHWNYGIMEVYIDGELKQQVDLYSPEIRVGDTVFTASKLAPGAHTIKLVCTGRKHPDANFTFIDLEAFQVR